MCAQRVMFFDGFVGRTAKNPNRIIAERVACAYQRYLVREDSDEPRYHIDRVIVVGEDVEGRRDVDILAWLGFAGIPADSIVLAGNAQDTLRAIEFFVAAATRLYPRVEQIKVHVVAHDWLLERICFYMHTWRQPGIVSPPAFLPRDCVPLGGYKPTFWERLREWSRRSDAAQAIYRQDFPEWWMQPGILGGD